MSVTALTMPQMALIPAATKDDKERGQAILANFWLFKTTKEVYREAPDGRSVKEDLKVFLKHKKLVIMLIIWMMASVGYGMMFSSCSSSATRI